MDANTYRIAEIEAEAIGKRALGKQYNLYSQGAPHGRATYSGPIVAETGVFVIQKISPLHTQRHEKTSLTDVPQVGQRVRISYGADMRAHVRADVPERKRTLCRHL